MATTVPHLSLEGFITNKKIILVKLIEHFLASDYSQSNTFAGQIASLKYILYNYATKEELKRNIVATLTNMYMKHFATVDVIVTIDETDDTSEQSINIDILAIDFNDVEYKLSRTIQELDGKITNFDALEEEINNG